MDKSNYFNNPEQSNYYELGYNWRMSSITAALGISQLSKLDKLIQMRKDNANYLSSRLQKHSKLQPPSPPDSINHIYQMYTVRLSSKTIRDDYHKYLLNNGIFSKVYFHPIHLMKFYKENFGDYHLPNTLNVSETILTLPLYPNMTDDEKNYIIDTTNEFFEDYEK